MCKSYCLISVQNLKLLCFCKMDQQAVLSFPERRGPKFQEYIELCLHRKFYARYVFLFFTFNFALSKSEAVLLMAGDFPALLKVVTKSPIFTSSPISLYIFSLYLGIQKTCDFFLFGFWLSRFFNDNCFCFSTFSSTISLGLLSTSEGSSSSSSSLPESSLYCLLFVIFFCLFFFCIKFSFPLIIYFPEKVFDILVLLILKA